MYGTQSRSYPDLVYLRLLLFVALALALGWGDTADASLLSFATGLFALIAALGSEKNYCVLRFMNIGQLEIVLSLRICSIVTGDLECIIKRGIYTLWDKLPGISDISESTFIC